MQQTLFEHSGDGANSEAEIVGKKNQENSMILMPADNGNRHVYLWHGRYGTMGWLLDAYALERGRLPWREMPWAVDNGVYRMFVAKEKHDADRFYRGLDRLLEAGIREGIAPSWVVVPDAVGNRDETLWRWDVHAPRLQKMGVLLAFAAQDDMTFADVPKEAELVFLGGSTGWKERALFPWCERFERVHVGRVNGYRMLIASYHAGAESIDGTGWFRGGPERWAPLEAFIKNQAARCVPHPRPLFNEMLSVWTRTQTIGT